MLSVKTPEEVYETIEDAIKYSLSARGSTGVVFVVGSLYLAGEIRKQFRA